MTGQLPQKWRGAMSTSPASPLGYHPEEWGDPDETYVLSQHYRKIAQSLAISYEAVERQSENMSGMTSECTIAWIAKAKMVAEVINEASNSYGNISLALLDFSAAIEEFKGAAEKANEQAIDAKRRRSVAAEEYRINRNAYLELKAKEEATGTPEPQLSRHLEKQNQAYHARQLAIESFDDARNAYKRAEEGFQLADDKAANQISEVTKSDKLGTGWFDSWGRSFTKGVIQVGDSSSLAFTAATPAAGAFGGFPAAVTGGLASLGSAISLLGNVALLTRKEGSKADTAMAAVGMIPMVGQGFIQGARKAANMHDMGKLAQYQRHKFVGANGRLPKANRAKIPRELLAHNGAGLLKGPLPKYNKKLKKDVIKSLKQESKETRKARWLWYDKNPNTPTDYSVLDGADPHLLNYRHGNSLTLAERVEKVRKIEAHDALNKKLEAGIFAYGVSQKTKEHYCGIKRRPFHDLLAPLICSKGTPKVDHEPIRSGPYNSLDRLGRR